MNRHKNLDWAERNVNVTMLALMLDINFVMVSALQRFDDAWRRKLESGELSLDQVRAAARTQLGVVKEAEFVLCADKSHLGLGDPITEVP